MPGTTISIRHKNGTSYDGTAARNIYPVSPSVSLAYDALNRVTNMVDEVGTTRYSYDAAGQLLTEDGPFTSDTVTNTYSNRPSHLSVALRSSFYDAYS